jgi:arabinofuranosyltransferase
MAINFPISTSRETKQFTKYIPVLAALLLFLILTLRRAWLSDDAYITFRTVDNFINGYRLTWNVSERVQSYTHPLWMFLVSLFYFFTHEIYLTSIFLSLIISLGAVSIFALKIAKTRVIAILAVIILALSNAFVDYSTSGLENPLSHLLFVLFLYYFLFKEESPTKLLAMSITASLAAVNRLDLFLLYLPALLYSFWINRSWKTFFILAAGQLPLILWELFSIFYYGFPFPNTAYAKLNTHIPALDLMDRGLRYLLFSLRSDPITLFVVLTALVFSILNRSRKNLLLATGIVLYLLYIIKIGGDFMSGRYFTTIFFCSVAILSQIKYDRLESKTILGLFFLSLIVGVSIVNPTWMMYNSNAFLSYRGVVDERLWYFPDVGLLRNNRFNTQPDTLGRTGGLEARQQSYKDFYVTPVNSIGVYGYYAGPNVHIIDRWALSDPLLARIPPQRQVKWIIGHLARIIPKGYITSIYTKNPVLEDANLSLYYEKLSIITRGSLFDLNRLGEIIKMNLGYYNYLIDEDAYRYPEMVKVTQADVSTPKDDGTPWDSPNNFQFNDSGIEIRLDQISHSNTLVISLDREDNYQVIFRKNKTDIATLEVQAPSASKAGLFKSTIETPKSASQAGFDEIRILPLTANGHYSLGFVTLSP